MTALTVHSCCEYLTAGSDWRDEDYNARVIVKSVKGEPFKGFWDITIKDKVIRIDQNNMDAGLNLAARVVASRLVELTDGPVTLVPIPNSQACIGVKPEFRTLMLAQAIAKHSKDKAIASPAILWNAPKSKQHQGAGYRHASQFIPKLKIVKKLETQVVLIDDVITSGSQMLACTYVLRKAGYKVPFGMAVAKTTSIQTPNALEWVSNELSQLII